MGYELLKLGLSAEQVYSYSYLIPLTTTDGMFLSFKTSPSYIYLLTHLILSNLTLTDRSAFNNKYGSAPQWLHNFPRANWARMGRGLVRWGMGLWG